MVSAKSLLYHCTEEKTYTYTNIFNFSLNFFVNCWI